MLDVIIIFIVILIIAGLFLYWFRGFWRTVQYDEGNRQDLQNIYHQVTQRLLTAMLTVNGGSVVTLLTYIYQSKDHDAALEKVSSPFLILGISLVMTIVMLGTDYLTALWQSINLERNPLLAASTMFFGVISFFGFIIGAIWLLKIFL